MPMVQPWSAFHFELNIHEGIAELEEEIVPGVFPENYQCLSHSRSNAREIPDE